MDSSNLHTYKIVLLGNGDSGKTTLVRRLLTGEYQKLYEPTLGVEVHPFRFCVVSGSTGMVSNVCFNLWDTAGQEKYADLGAGYYLCADAAIICSSATLHKKERLDDISKWVTRFQNVCDDVPIILASTKVDIFISTLTQAPPLITKHILTSARTCYRFSEPFLALAKILLDDNTLYIGESPARSPPVVKIPRWTLAQV